MVNIGTDRSPERARQDYIKLIYQLGERKPVRAAELARSLGVTRASVSKFKRMLERERLLERSHARTDTLRLTKKGLQLAVRMVRRHRLVETFLHKKLHMPLDRVHSEAERIEHAISDEVSVRLARFLEYPHTDPHGHHIPKGNASRKVSAEMALSSCAPPQKILVRSVDDRNARTVRRLLTLGVLPGMHATVVHKDEHAVRLLTKKGPISVPLDAAADVRCVLEASRRRAA